MYFLVLVFLKIKVNKKTFFIVLILNLYLKIQTYKTIKKFLPVGKLNFSSASNCEAIPVQHKHIDIIWPNTIAIQIRL